MTPPETGGRKDDSGPDKPRYDLIPTYPLRLLAELYSIGSRKYADHNWRKGLAFSRLFSAMMRHSWLWWGGEEVDPTDGQHHLTSVAWNAFALLDLQRTMPSMDDRWETPAAAAERDAKLGEVTDAAGGRQPSELWLDGVYPPSGPFPHHQSYTIKVCPVCGGLPTAIQPTPGEGAQGGIYITGCRRGHEVVTTARFITIKVVPE